MAYSLLLGRIQEAFMNTTYAVGCFLTSAAPFDKLKSRAALGGRPRFSCQEKDTSEFAAENALYAFDRLHKE
jgi:hypothetical protein